ncbi:MAG: methylated-DNA--[protein]-cysteine S-methyltransferase [Clostridiales bacterium]|nr:methylated-DNA--[protein]-cysteine S-methyltransferase [Clostridiales bacterium]
MEKKLYKKAIAAPFGPMALYATDEALVYVLFENPKSHVKMERYLNRYFGDHTVVEQENALLAQAARELEAYFAGKQRAFTTPFVLKGTAYQNQVWNCIASIPYGQVITYRALATAAGDAGGTRSAGAACGANPISIFNPCHRILGASRSLTGFGGGLDAKRWLLTLEGHPLEQDRFGGAFSEFSILG